MWKDIFDKGLFRIGWVNRFAAELIFWLILSFLAFIAYKFGAFALNISISILWGAIALFYLYWIIRIIMLFIQTK